IVIDRPSRRAALVGSRSDWVVNSSLLVLSSAFALLVLLGVMAAGSNQEAPRIAIKVTDNAQGADDATSIAPGLEQELRHQLAQMTNLEPITPEHPSDVRDIVKLVLWVSVQTEAGRVQVRALLQSLAGDGSYPYVGSFELPMGPSSAIERQAAKRIAAELRDALHGAAGPSRASARPVVFSAGAGTREAGRTLLGGRGSGLRAALPPGPRRASRAPRAPTGPTRAPQ